MSKQTTILIKLDEDTKKSFQRAVKENNRNMNLVVRDFIINYVKKNNQGDLFK